MVRYFEKLPARAPDDLNADDAVFVITDTLIVFDNIRHTIKVVSCAATEGAQDLKDVYDKTIDKIDRLIAILRTPVETKERYRKVDNDAPLG
jgi:anthranilate synthase component 1